MAVEVSATLPFPPHALDLHNPSRWTTLLPLIRPSIQSVRTAKGQTVLLDTGLLSDSSSGLVRIACIGNVGNFSSKLLHDRHVCAVVTEQPGAGLLTARDVVYAVAGAAGQGKGSSAGWVVVRSGKERKASMDGTDLVEVEVNGDLEFEHLIHLLGAVGSNIRSSVHQVADLVKLFVKTASTAHSSFHIEKAEGNPAVVHVEGAAGFEKAKHAVERDLKHVMRAHTTQEGPVTYSIHYADVNGLSRLENYILGLEIAQYFDSQNLPYSLSTSTILSHSKPARGFAISISPIPKSMLRPQAAPSSPPNATTFTTTTTRSLSANAQISFSDAAIRNRIHDGCNAVIAAEPTITRYDEIVGDGDCGYTLRDGAKQVLSFVADKDLSKLPDTLSALVHDLEVNMGGTSGALYCIFLTSLAGALASETSVALALDKALAQLLQYTRARLGDRTMLDCLIPFVETLKNGNGDAGPALAEARKGVEGTKELEAKLGRSTYLDESATKGVPDPGAYGLLVLLEGMCKE